MKPTAKYLGDDHFQSLLSEVKCDFPIHELRTYLLGFIIAIDLVPMSHILEEILLVGTDDGVVFESDEQMQKFISQQQALWNEIADDVQKGKVPKLKKLPDNLKDPAMLFMAIVIRMNEIDSFLGALMEGGTDYKSCPDKKASEIMERLEQVTDYFEGYLQKLEKKKKPSPDELLETESVLFLFEKEWSKKFKELEKRLRTIRVAEMQKRQESQKQATSKKVGRNEPCPCGSGKKYKVCCGIVH